MTEKQTINGKDVWLKVDSHPVQRDNQHIIPTEYFIATYYLKEPTDDSKDGQIIKDEDGEPKKFESPVAALTYAWENVQNIVTEWSI